MFFTFLNIFGHHRLVVGLPPPMNNEYSLERKLCFFRATLEEKDHVFQNSLINYFLSPQSFKDENADK